ncbi:helix-turn-helix transcriptional regulator [Silicimonas sp. MF1-12-2]|uniref:helix-turn-helix transcriptional regulator n=1 Tax=Silicimonas sp. MF1-12-2 TaxID=3384793 RepID=UPI0039B40200
MSSEVRRGASFELTTNGVAPSLGLSQLRELFETKVQLRFDADPDQRIDARMTVHGLPGLRYANMVSSMNVSLERPTQLLSDREDDVCLILSTGGPIAIAQRNKQSQANDGEAVLLVYREPAVLRFHAMNYVAVRVPYAALAPLTKNMAADAGRHIKRDTVALTLLETYLRSLPISIADPQLRGVVTTHVYDLMALAIGASREGTEIAVQRSLKAARLQAIKAALVNDRDLSIHEIARSQAVTPRYVQKLFDEAGTTFTEFVLALRLEAARAMLLSPRYSHWTVAAISQEAGFGDLSYFNRRFKARYEQTPSDVRAQSALPS